MNKSNSKLSLLTTAALAIPTPGMTANVPEKTVLSFQTMSYQEDDLAANRSSSGNAESRYSIQANKFGLLTAIGDSTSLSVDILTETLSGASPWFNSEVGGEPVTTMSGASISEQRNETGASLSFYKATETHTVGLTMTQENDYSAQAINYDYAKDFNRKNTTLSGGVSVSSDRVFPTQSAPLHANQVDGIDSASKQSQSVYIGLSQNINIRTIARFGLSYTQLSGYLSDPYKLFDHRPDSREQTVLSAAIRYFHYDTQTAYHLDYRYYADDWGVMSDTYTFKAYINLQNRWQIVPGVRYYSQTGADFYSPFLPTGANVGNAYYSEDFRLSYYGAVSYTLDIYKQFNDWRLKVSLERYESESEYSQSTAVYDNPGLVDFSMTSIGIEYSF